MSVKNSSGYVIILKIIDKKVKKLFQPLFWMVFYFYGWLGYLYHNSLSDEYHEIIQFLWNTLNNQLK